MWSTLVLPYKLHMEITQLKEASPKLLEEINALLPQLRSDPENQRGSLEELQHVVADDHAVVMVIKDGDRIIGMGSLFIIFNIGEKIGDIEDVVVDEKYRGQGLGKQLMSALIDAARERNLQELYLTSRSSRVAANNLYQALGFEKKDTNVYKLKL